MLQMASQVQELKGNIRVYCRVRPLIGDIERRSASAMSTRRSRELGDTSLHKYKLFMYNYIYIYV